MFTFAWLFRWLPQWRRRSVSLTWAALLTTPLPTRTEAVSPMSGCRLCWPLAVCCHLQVVFATTFPPFSAVSFSSTSLPSLAAPYSGSWRFVWLVFQCPCWLKHTCWFVFLFSDNPSPASVFQWLAAKLSLPRFDALLPSVHSPADSSVRAGSGTEEAVHLWVVVP